MFRKNKIEVDDLEGQSVTINKEGENKIKAARKKYDADMKAVDEKYKKDHAELLKAYGEGAKESKLKFWAKSKTEDMTDPKYWVLVNAQSIKEFIKYGSNKVLDQIRITMIGETGRELPNDPRDTLGLPQQ